MEQGSGFSEPDEDGVRSCLRCGDTDSDHQRVTGSMSAPTAPCKIIGCDCKGWPDEKGSPLCVVCGGHIDAADPTPYCSPLCGAPTFVGLNTYAHRQQGWMAVWRTATGNVIHQSFRHTEVSVEWPADRVREYALAHPVGW